MAWERENNCCGCDKCIGCGQKNRWFMHCYCDNCGSEIEEVGFTDGKIDLCSYCAASIVVNKLTNETDRPHIIEDMKKNNYHEYDLEDVEEWFGTSIEDYFETFLVDEYYHE